MSNSTSGEGAPLGATGVLAEFIARPRAGAQPNADAVARVLVDTVAVAIAGVDTDVAELLLKWIETEKAPGAAAVWGTDLSLAPSQAALVNGTTAHILDWDDAVPGIPFHPGAVMVPALFAQLAVEDASGERVVAAYNVGSAVSRAISEVLPIGYHYGKGWHNTSTTGRFAAAAAVAHLVGLDVEQTKHVLGMIASMVAGSLSNFGTMTKSLHAGMAARDAVMAVALARSGYTANGTQLEDRRGFFAMYGDTTPELLATLGERLEKWETRWVDDWALKRYPSCYATHRAIDAALEVAEQLAEQGGGPAQVTAIEVSVPKGGSPYSQGSPLINFVPTTGLEGKFALDYTVSRAIASNSVLLADFTDERVWEDDVRRLMGVWSVVERGEGELAPDGSLTSVAVTLADGTEIRRGVDVTYGDSRKPLSDEQVTEKFTSALTAVGWKADDAADLAAELWAAPADASLSWVQDALHAKA